MGTETQPSASTATLEPPAAEVSLQPTKAPSFPSVAIGEKEPVAAEPEPKASTGAQENGQQADPEDLPDELIEKFEKHPKFQSRVDKIVRKSVETERQTWQATQAAQAAEEAKRQADSDYEAMLEQVANGTWDEKAQTTANKALLQRIQGRHADLGRMATLQGLAQEAEAAYQAIPEFKDEETLTKVRQASMGSATGWLTTLADAIREQNTKELTAKFEKDKAKLAAALKEDVRGEVRASMRVPDLGDATTSARASQGFQYLEDAEQALMEGRISTGRLRALSRVLPRQRGRAA